MNERVSVLMRECRALEGAVGVRVTGNFVPWSEQEVSDSQDILDAKTLYNEQVRVAQQRYHELTTPARMEYEEAFALALEGLLLAFKERYL